MDGLFHAGFIDGGIMNVVNCFEQYLIGQSAAF
jgi:hypothetical protein